MKHLKFLFLLLLLPFCAYAAGDHAYFATQDDGDFGHGTISHTVNGHRVILYSFCHFDGCPDGAAPLNPVFLNDDGSVSGVTSAGGQIPFYGGPGGVLFRIESVVPGLQWRQSAKIDLCSYYLDCAHYGSPFSVDQVEPGHFMIMTCTHHCWKGERVLVKPDEGTYNPLETWAGHPDQ